MTTERSDEFGDHVGNLDKAERTETGQEVANVQWADALATACFRFRRRRYKTGELEVNLILRTPETTPAAPHSAKVVQVFLGCRDHVQSEPVFVWASAGWQYWVTSLTAKRSVVQPLLFGAGSQCGCDPWLDARPAREVYEGVREWLKLWD